MIRYWTLVYSKLFFAIISWMITIMFSKVHTKCSNHRLLPVSLYSLDFLPSLLVSILLWIDRFSSVLMFSFSPPYWNQKKCEHPMPVMFMHEDRKIWKTSYRSYRTSYRFNRSHPFGICDRHPCPPLNRKFVFIIYYFYYLFIPVIWLNTKNLSTFCKF